MSLHTQVYTQCSIAKGSELSFSFGEGRGEGGGGGGGKVKGKEWKEGEDGGARGERRTEGACAQMSHVCREGLCAYDYSKCYFSSGVVPVKHVSPQHASGRPVSPTRPPDILYGPQGQRSNGRILT